jgi:hypothetical protein
LSLALVLFAILSAAEVYCFSATLSEPEVDRYNVRVGTQTFAGLYQFTTNSLLVETAQGIRDLGSDIIKMYLGADFPRQYRLALPANVTNLATLARDEPSCRRVLDMPFRHFIAWAYPFANADAAWNDGYSDSERSNDYGELYDLTRYLLTNYDNSGKTFYLGHWEGDGYLAPWTTNAGPVAIEGMIAWLNNRQKAIDDAKAATPHTNVNVFCYAEANRVRDAMLNGPTNNQRVINMVVPYVTNLDYLSYSSYDSMDLPASELYATLDYMEAMLPTNKVATIPGERIWIGEYGWGGFSTDSQEPLSRAYLQRLFNYGRKAFPFLLFWEIYNNEPNRNFCLIDSNNVKVACYYLHERFISNAKLLVAQFKERNSRTPIESEFVSLVSPILNSSLPAPVRLSVTNLGASVFNSGISASVSGTVAQGVYGDDCAQLWVYWGLHDGGTSRSNWDQVQFVGLNTNFNPKPFNISLTNLAPGTGYFFRFYATNANGDAWAPSSTPFSTSAFLPSDYGANMSIAFPGYTRTNALLNFPALVKLGTQLPGFSYRQFASPTGEDLRFTDSTGTVLLPHEIDQWDTNGVSYVWVRVPKLTGTSDYVWAYWGNPAALEPPAWTTNGEVWGPASLLVWHLQEAGFPYVDSTGQHPGAPGIAPGSSSGVIGRGCSFDGTSKYLAAGVFDLGPAFTISAWLRLNPTASDIQTIWANKAGGWNMPGFALFVNSYQTRDGKLLLETGNGTTGVTASTPPNSVSFGQWHRVTAVVDKLSAAASLYVDGTDLTQAGTLQPDFLSEADLNLGRFTNNAFYLNGTLDEVRVESGIRSPDWIWASWMTVASNATWTSYSTVMQVSPALSVSTAANGLLLSWPGSALGFTLYSATDLTQPVLWSLVTNLPSLAKNQWQVRLSLDASKTEFFRLQSP